MNTPSSSFADKSILSKLTEEQRKQFSSMWNNVPRENILYLSQEEYDDFVDKLNNPDPESVRRLKEFLSSDTYKSVITDDRRTP